MTIETDTLRRETLIVAAQYKDGWKYYLWRGLFAGALGFCALVWPTISLSVLLALVGIYCLIDGVTGMASAIRTADRGVGIIQAVFSLAVGAVLLFWPGTTLKTLLIIFGIWVLISGISQILTARRMMVYQSERGLVTGIGAVTIAFGLILVFWPGTGIVAIAWAIAAAALLIAAMLISLALRLKRLADSA